MKMILAVIQPTKIRAVQEALQKFGVERITICDSQVYARDEGEIPIFRGVPNRAELLRTVTLEIAVNDDFLARTVETICDVARTGRAGNDGDGKIFILPLEEAIQFSPEQRGPGAI